MKMKQLIKHSIYVLALTGMLVGCGSKTNEGTTNSKFKMLDTDLKVGMVTGVGSIDDRSFNQGTWEGITGTVKNNKYIKPSGETTSDYLTAISNLYDGDFKFIITPGYKFEAAIYDAQAKYEDVQFVLLDGSPQSETGEKAIGENTVSIFFAEQEAGFIAGIAAAVELQEGDFGFLGGMPIPAVERFEIGFAHGIEYANANLNTNVTLKSENIVYQGTFDDKAAGQQIAAQMYDRGVEVIFTAAGGTGIGAINEAKQRAMQGTKVWVIGVDSDQFKDGIYNEETGESVILTSAVKNIDQAAHDMIVAKVNDTFPGGEQLTFSIANDGVGIPAENPNLSEATINTVSDIYAKVKAGDIIVNSTK